MRRETSFVLLPDTDAARDAARLVGVSSGAQVIVHASGRPWLVGHWPSGHIRVAEAGRVRVAVAGFCPATGQELEAAAGRLRSVADLGTMARELAGSAHLLASVGGRVRAQGTASGVRAVFHARLGGVTIAADRPDTLAPLIGAEPDEEALALRLLTPCAPYPLMDRPVWRGVRQVAPGSYLHLERDGTARTAVWWNPPEPSLPLREGAAAVREALCTAVRGRVRSAKAVSTDLSGGMDSGTVTHLAAELAPGLVTVRTPQLDAGGDDALWAARIADRLPEARHLLLEYEQAPTMFAGLDDGGRLALGSEPPFWSRGGARLVDVAERVAARGSRLHLCGHGGDEVFHSPHVSLHTLVRRRPWTGARRAYERRSLGNWPLWPTVRGLADVRSLPAALIFGSTQLHDPPPSQFTPHLGWTPPLRMPPWATPEAVAAVRDLLRRAAHDRPRPLGPDRAAHATVEAVQRGGAAVRYAAGLMARYGVDFAAPFLDDRVIEAALAVRLHERATPRRYKPLLAEAMRGLVPDDLLGRSTKGNYGEDTFDGLRRHRATLLGLFEGSLLARRGLVDEAAVRAALRADHAFHQPIQALEPTLSGEVWLRTLPDRTRRPAAEGAP
ncbi:asparagine synthase-related protein [Streptomyces palmae]|uniref:asparagine synthase (glutamine-hydrolyzing) n=1 Tax=Streptomyces palmae TaxID=1701085 RepID=A0A4Z0GP17_9ACTN|nr:asparagine synthase-related protein [Streptomyces palmae]TGA98050.1 asparagine synthase [Streptomyces palmae]